MPSGHFRRASVHHGGKVGRNGNAILAKCRIAKFSLYELFYNTHLFLTK